MGDKSKIEWTDAEWTVVQGCDPVSPGCANCYVPKVLWRMAHNPNPKIAAPLKGLAEKHKDKLRFTGRVACREDRLGWPLEWKAPRKIFVPSHGDIFHEDVPDSFIDRIFAVMARCPQHVFQVLTKRPERMRAYIKTSLWTGLHGPNGPKPGWPLANCWLGVSAEDQARADERIPILLDTPAAVHFISAEPLLGPINLTPDTEVGPLSWLTRHNIMDDKLTSRIDWVIAGGESGPGARPCHPDWIRGLRDQCAAAGVAFFFKQWGEWGADLTGPAIIAAGSGVAWPDGTIGKGRSDTNGGDGLSLRRVGKKAAGAMLDGREHRKFPR